MRRDRLGDLVVDSKHRVECAQGILKYGPYALSAYPAHPSFGEPHQILAVEHQPIDADRRSRDVDEPEYGQRREGLARSRLADQTEGFTGLDLEVDVAHHLGASTLDRQLDREPADLEERRHVRLLGAKHRRAGFMGACDGWRRVARIQAIYSYLRRQYG